MGKLWLFPTAAVSLSLSGCMTTVSQQEETFIYANSLLNSLLLLAVAVALLGFGTAFLWLAFRRAGAAPRNAPTHY